jgi:carboxymethylenebutenolidase
MRITLPSGTAAELSLPEGGPARCVVLVPDVMGLRPLFDDMCARLTAEHGWAVAAVEPFPGREHLRIEERFAAMPAVSDDDHLGDLIEAADVLADRTGADRVAVLGFCMGGMYTLKAAGTGRFDRAAAFYGMIRVPAGWEGPGQRQPLDWLAEPSPTQVLAILGGSDPATPPDDIEALRAIGDRVEVVVYPEGQHGFVHDPARPAHRSADAADAWARVVEFLA